MVSPDPTISRFSAEFTDPQTERRFRRVTAAPLKASYASPDA